jgi:hypothetical protein
MRGGCAALAPGLSEFARPLAGRPRAIVPPKVFRFFGAKKPLMTAVQKSARIGLMPTKLTSIPISVGTMIMA